MILFVGVPHAMVLFVGDPPRDDSDSCGSHENFACRPFFRAAAHVGATGPAKIRAAAIKTVRFGVVLPKAPPAPIWKLGLDRPGPCDFLLF